MAPVMSATRSSMPVRVCRPVAGPGASDPAYHAHVAAAVAFSRRTFLVDLGRGSVAIALVSLAGCATPARLASSGQPSAASSAAPGPTGATASGATAGTSEGVTWERVNLGFVSAYILVRAGEAAIVDTGEVGSDDEITAALEGAGLGWDAVGHVILTHWHPDHAGSISAVLDLAPLATGYAGTADIPSIVASRELKPVEDGDRVFDLRIVGTPGHTAGHVSVLDEVGGVLVAGDALGTVGGPLAGSDPQFTENADAARASVVKLGGLQFETLLVGHGDPILSGASAQVAALAGG